MQFATKMCLSQFQTSELEISTGRAVCCTYVCLTPGSISLFRTFFIDKHVIKNLSISNTITFHCSHNNLSNYFQL